MRNSEDDALDTNIAKDSGDGMFILQYCSSVPGTVSTGSSTLASNPSASSGASTGSTVSGLTAASASQFTGGRGSRIVDLAPIAAITSLKPSSAKLKD